MASEPTQPNSLSKISAISLFVEDIATAKAFYTTVFAVPVVFEDATSCAVKFDNLIVNLLVASEADKLVTPAHVGGPDAGRRFQLTIWVANLEKVTGALLRQGVNILTGPHVQPWGMMTLTFVDPAGHSWEVAQNMSDK